MSARYTPSPSIVKVLLWMNGLIFVTQTLFHRWFGSLLIERLFSLHIPSFWAGNYWTPLTYCFLHGSLEHVLMNSLLIFFIGKGLEQLLTPSSFLLLYFGGAVCGGFLWMLCNSHAYAPLVGASAAGMALLIFFCLLRPDQPLTLLLFFIIPITVKPKWIIRFTFLFELFGLLFNELQGTSSISHSAHLGGCLWGGLFYFLFTKRPKLLIEAPAWVRRRSLRLVREHVNEG